MNTITNITNNSQTNSTIATDSDGVIHFKEYDSQLAIPEVEGTRIIKCLYKADPKTGKKSKENSYIRIPSNHINEEVIAEKIVDLAPYFVAFLQETEDKIIKDAHKNGALNVFVPNLTIDAVINYLEENSTSGRLNKQDIEKWFDDNISDSLTELFAEKLGVNENSGENELIKLQTIINAYKAKFASLASPKVVFNETDQISMLNVLEKSGGMDSLIGKRFAARIEKMKEKEDDILLAL